MKVYDLTSVEQAEWALEHNDELGKDLVNRLTRASQAMSASLELPARPVRRVLAPRFVR